MFILIEYTILLALNIGLHRILENKEMAWRPRLGSTAVLIAGRARQIPWILSSAMNHHYEMYTRKLSGVSMRGNTTHHPGTHHQHHQGLIQCPTVPRLILYKPEIYTYGFDGALTLHFWRFLLPFVMLWFPPDS